MIDKTDILILKIMQEDGRASVSEIAKKVKLSIPAVGERIKKLSEKGFLKKFVTRRMLQFAIHYVLYASKRVQ